MRRRLTLSVASVAVAGLVTTGLFAPLFGPGTRLDGHFPTQEDLAKPRSFDSGIPDSPYGRLQSVEVRKRERRNLIDRVQHESSVVVVLRTEHGLVVERVSGTNLKGARSDVLSHAELRPDDVPSGLLTAGEQVEHRDAFRVRGNLAAPYTTGGLSP
jgi:hypothetical protein